MIDVGVERPQNSGITALRLSADAVSRGVPLSIEADWPISARPASEPSSSISDRGDGTARSSAGSRPSTFGQDEPAQRRFALGRARTAACTRDSSSWPAADALAADDTRYFSVEVTDARKMLLAAPAPADDYTFLLREVLAPYELRLKKEAKFDCHVVPLDQLPKQPLAEYAADLPGRSGAAGRRRLATTGRLRRRRRGRGHFSGRNARPVEAFPARPRSKSCPASCCGSGGPAIATSIWRPSNSSIRCWPSSVRWKARSPGTLIRSTPIGSSGRWPSGAGVVIAFSNTLPALIEQPIGRGRVLTMTTPVSDSASDPDGWNRLPTGDEPWPFVVLANEMMYYLTSGSHSKLNYLAGETAVIRLPADAHQSIFSLHSARRAIPCGKPVDERQNAVVVSSTDLPGNYRLQAGGDDGVRLGFSVNGSAETSQLERATPDGTGPGVWRRAVSRRAQPGTKSSAT